MLSLLIASVAVAIMNLHENIVELYFNIESNDEADSNTLFSNLIKNIFFTVFFLIAIIITAKTYLKLMRNRPKPSDIKKPKQEIKNPAKTARTRAIFYLVLLPVFYIIFLIVGISVVYPDRSEVSIIELQNFAFIPMFVLWAVMGSYLKIHKKIHTAKEYFEKFNYEYIISERIIVGKIRTISVLSMIGFLAILMIFNSFYNNQSEESAFIEWTTFSISFGMFNIAMFSFMKITRLEKMRGFKLFIASGFCKNCIKHDELKAKNLTWALKWYGDFLKRLDHCGKMQIYSIVMRILASNSRNSILEKLTVNLESTDGYAAINKIAEIMNVNVDELFENETLGQKIKGLLVLVGGIVAILGFAYQTIMTFIDSF